MAKLKYYNNEKPVSAFEMLIEVVRWLVYQIAVGLAQYWVLTAMNCSYSQKDISGPLLTKTPGLKNYN